MVEERVLTWWKYGGVNVVEVEKREYFICKNFCLDGNCRNRFHFFFHPVVSTTFSTTFFHHVKFGVAALLLLLFFSLLFNKEKKEKIFVKRPPPRGYMVETNGGSLYICHALHTLTCPGAL